MPTHLKFRKFDSESLSDDRLGFFFNSFYFFKQSTVGVMNTHKMLVPKSLLTFFKI